MGLTQNFIIRTVLAMAFVGFAPSAGAGLWPSTSEDYKMLPPYCAAKMGRTSEADQTKWENTIGKGFVHVHHYCAGLHEINQSYLAKSDKDLDARLRGALKQFQYMIDRVPVTFILLPEIYLKRGQVLERQGRLIEAEKAMLRSISLKKNWPPAYIALGDLYMRQGKRARAQEIFSTGLEYAPKSKTLRKRLRTLK